MEGVEGGRGWNALRLHSSERKLNCIEELSRGSWVGGVWVRGGEWGGVGV